MGFFKSKPEKIERISNLRPGQQEDLFTQYQNAIAGEGAGGAFGDVRDYYSSLLSGGQDSAFEAPLMRQFQEDIMPGIAEQFAGLGAGGLSSGGFAQEAGRASTDLAERIGSMRAQLRQQGAQGLMGFAQGGLNPVDQTLFRPREPSAFESMFGGVVTGLGKGLATSISGGIGSTIDQVSKLFGKR